LIDTSMWWVFCSADRAFDQDPFDQDPFDQDPFDHSDLPADAFPDDEADEADEPAPTTVLTVKEPLQNKLARAQASQLSSPTSPTDEREALPKMPSESSKSDDDSPLAAAPSALGLAFQSFFQPADCVQQCAEAAEDDDDDSFLAVFDSPQLGRSGAVHADPHRAWPHEAAAADPMAAVLIPPPRQKKGMIIHVHAPRKSLPTEGYDIQWKVDPPHPSGLVRAQARVMLERHSSAYACSETGASIEFDQDGERLEIARITCVRLKPQQLQRNSNTSWRAQYPAVAQYLSAVVSPDDDNNNGHARFHALQHLLISDLHVHADYRGGGLGLSLLDLATRRVGDPLAWTVLALPDHTAAAPLEPHGTPMAGTPPPSLPPVRHSPHDEPPSEADDSLQRYFGLLGFAPTVHDRYMARAIARRVLLAEASPRAPELGVTDDY
jgi:hypothetical protein